MIHKLIQRKHYFQYIWSEVRITNKLIKTTIQITTLKKNFYLHSKYFAIIVVL